MILNFRYGFGEGGFCSKVSCIPDRFCQLVGGAIGVAVVAIIAGNWMLGCRIGNSYKVSGMIGLVYFCMIFAEYPWLGFTNSANYHFSGVIAVVLFGFWVSSGGRQKMVAKGGHHLVHMHHAVAEFVAHIANEVIFVVAGLLTWRYLFGQEQQL